MVKINWTLLESWVFKYWNFVWFFLFYNCLFDGLFTYFSTWAGYAVELNPIVIFLSPLGALFLNLILLFFIRRRKDMKVYTFISMFIASLFFYLPANINHIYLFIKSFF